MGSGRGNCVKNVLAKWKTAVCAAVKHRETPLWGPPNPVGKLTFPSVLARVVLTMNAVELELLPGRNAEPARGGLHRSSAAP